MFSATVMEEDLESGNFDCGFGLKEVLKSLLKEDLEIVCMVFQISFGLVWESF